MAPMTYQQVFAHVLEHLRRSPQGQYGDLVEWVAQKAGAPVQAFGTRRGREVELARQAYWDCVVKGIIIPGMNANNPGWPWYSLTEHGVEVAEKGVPQPYDRDGFLLAFRRDVPHADAIVEGYLIEAVEAFNAGCLRAASVMLGVASEQLVLLLIEAFKAAITDGSKGTAFERDLKPWPILTRFQALKSRLDAMVTAKKLPVEHVETVQTVLGGVFDLLRQSRNNAGHPNVPGTIMADTVFIHLRMFIDYTRRVTALIEYFKATDADW